MVVQLKPFVAQLWAALYSKGADDHHVLVQQVATALNWMKTLFTSTDMLYATIHLKPARLRTAIATDASPTGGGALLCVIPQRQDPGDFHLDIKVPSQHPDNFQAL